LANILHNHWQANTLSPSFTHPSFILPFPPQPLLQTTASKFLQQELHGNKLADLLLCLLENIQKMTRLLPQNW
jgi:hypothetical protein